MLISNQRPEILWRVAICGLAAVLAGFVALAAFAAPEHDDFCFAYMIRDAGFGQTIIDFYNGLTGRIAGLAIIEAPGAIALLFGTGLLTSYSLALAVGAIALFASCAAIAAHALPWSRGAPRLFIALVFATSVVAAAPSPHDMLYWMPSFACYMPPAIASIAFLSEIARLAPKDEPMPPARIMLLATLGLIGALCNEFTGPWLVLIITSAVAVRYVLGRELQLTRHALVAAPALLGFAVVLASPGNPARIAASGGARSIGRSLFQALRYATDSLGHFISNPAVIACLGAAAVVALIGKPTVHARTNKVVAAAILIACLAACYLAFFTHEFSTGERIVPRAQNQTMILLLFGAMLSVALLAQAYLPHISFARESVALPVALMLLVSAGLAFSPTGRLILKERALIAPFQREARERDQALQSAATTATVEKHRFAPRLLMRADIGANIGCAAAYYHKALISVAD